MCLSAKKPCFVRNHKVKITNEIHVKVNYSNVP